jgi:hypothetical protein
MRRLAVFALAFAAASGLALVPAAADEVTLEGTIVCAKCTLKKPDAKECHNVLLVPDKDGKDDAEYYFAKSEAGDAVGEICMEKKKVTVTGTVSDKDGKRWITASKVTDRR